GHTDLVRDLAARGAGLMVFTFGVYIALRVAGLTRLAATVLGGTGVFGLVLGIAFRDIAENMLASILLTRQPPFRLRDLVEIAGIEGVVQRLTARATVLMSLDGKPCADPELDGVQKRHPEFHEQPEAAHRFHDRDRSNGSRRDRSGDRADSGLEPPGGARHA